MVDFSLWIGYAGDLAGNPTDTEAQRAAAAWRRIQDKSNSVVFRKPDGSDLAAQNVRLESDTSATMAESMAGAAPRRKLILFGVRNHPDAAVLDTDVNEGYRFNYAGDQYTVQDIIVTLGEVQAISEAIG